MPALELGIEGSNIGTQYTTVHRLLTNKVA